MTAKKTRFVMIGGFLGAGKTTTIARLAKHYIDEGSQVGLVTNDQAYDLVDTQSLRAQGFRVGEVPGACFCCKFDDLVDTAHDLAEEQIPDVVITEPVGSCTDLVATVIEPLRQLHGQRYSIAPLVVLLKPEHGKKILQQGVGSGFSPKAAYIFLKQIEEADIVAVNKIDKMSQPEQQELIALVQERFPEKKVFAMSARDGSGFSSLIEAIGSDEIEHARMMDVDYDVYAEGEAELGWLNCSATVEAPRCTQPIPLDQLAEELVERTASALRQSQAEPAHLKVLVQDQDGHAAMANLVGSDVDVDLSLATGAQARQVEVTINARVATSPEDLEATVRAALSWVASQRDLSSEVKRVQAFRPGRPTPTHRVSTGRIPRAT